MKNLINRLRKLEHQKGSICILYSYHHQASQNQIEIARTEAINRYITEGGDPNLTQTLIGIIEFSNTPKESHWFYTS